MAANLKIILTDKGEETLNDVKKIYGISTAPKMWKRLLASEAVRQGLCAPEDQEELLSEL